MKRLLTILLLFVSVSVFGQLQPAPSGTLTPLSTNQAYVRLSDSTYYFYNGTNYLWNYFLNKQQADKLYQPLGSPVATPFSLSAGYGLSGSSFNGSVARTFTADTTSATGLVSKSRLATNLGGYVPSSRTITINGSTRDLTANRIFNVGTVLSVGATAGTGISIAGTSPITSSGTYTITNTAPDQTVVLNAGTGISTSGTYPNFTITNTLPAVVGIQDSLTKKANRTFDNVASGAIANIKLANSTISGVALGSNLNALTLGNGLTGTSYNGSGAVTATADTAVVQTVSNFFPKGDTRYARTGATGTVTSVGATAGTGISVSGSPITSSGNITVTNTLPDQTVVLNNGTGISNTGTYPNFTVTNTAPDQTVVLNAGTGISTSGTYPNFTITNTSPSSGGTVTSITPGYGLTPQTSITTTGGFAVDTLVLDTVYAKISDAANINIGSISSTPNSNGISYASDTLKLHAVTATTGGILTTGIDSIAGDKYFTDQIWITENQQHGGHIGIVSGSGSLMAPLLGSASETSTYWMQILAHPAPNLYNTNPTDGIIFQVYDNEGPDPITAGNAFNFKNGTNSLVRVTYDGDTEFRGGLNLQDNRVSNGAISLGSGAPGSLNPTLNANSESSTAWFNFGGSPATNIDNTNPTDAFKFNAYKSNDGSQALTGGNLVNFYNKDVSKFSVDYNGVITSAGLGTGTVYSTSGVLSNTAPTSGTIGYWSRTGTVLSPATSGDDITTTGDITGGVGSFTSSGATGAASITQSSGAGVGLTITKGGNGEGLYVNKTSGSGNAVTVVGTLDATTLVKNGGTSAQFLKADGSVDGTAYTALNGTGIVEMAGTTPSYLSSTGSGNVVKATSPTLTTPNIGNATFGTLTGGTASTITFANTSAGGIQDAISIRNGGTTAGTGNRINFITGTATQSARINSVLTSSTVADLVFSTMTGGTLGEAGRFLGDKTLQLAAGLTAVGSISSTPQGTLYGTAAGSITSTQLATSLTDETGTGSVVFGTSPTLVTPALGNATGGTLSLSGMLTSTQGNNTQIFNSATATTGYQFGRMTNTSGGLLWGIEGSAAGSLLTGGSAYGGVLTTSTSTNLEFGTNQVKAITIDGTTQDVTIANNITADNLLSGTYTPTLTNGTNVDSSTSSVCQYTRVGNIVTVFGKIDVDATTLNSQTDVDISLPISSNFAAVTDLNGMTTTMGTNSGYGFVKASIANDRGTLSYFAASTTTTSQYFSFSYQIL